MKLGVDLRVIRGVFGDTLDEIAAAARGSGSPKRRKRVAEYLGNLVDRKFARADDAAAVLSMRAQDARSLRDRLNTALESVQCTHFLTFTHSHFHTLTFFIPSKFSSPSLRLLHNECNG